MSGAAFASPSLDKVDAIAIEEQMKELDKVRYSDLGEGERFSRLAIIGDTIARLCKGERLLPPHLGIEGADIRWRGYRISVTAAELRLVRLLAERHGRHCGFRELHEALHDGPFAAGRDGNDIQGGLRAAVKRVRRKFQAVDPRFDAIEPVRGFGYRWAA